LFDDDSDELTEQSVSRTLTVFVSTECTVFVAVTVFVCSARERR
jgi:hypothetical protein